MDFGGMMKQAKALQDAMAQAQAEIQALEVEGVSGGGMVTITLGGDGQARRVSLDPSLLNNDEGEVLEDLLVAAFNDAKRKADEAAQERMKAAAGPFAAMMPPGMKPF